MLLWISERTPLFGFQEPGYDPTAIAISRSAEVAAVASLGASLAGRFAGTAPEAPVVADNASRHRHKRDTQ